MFVTSFLVRLLEASVHYGQNDNVQRAMRATLIYVLHVPLITCPLEITTSDLFTL